MRLTSLFALAVISGIWNGAAAQTIVTTTKPLAAVWFPTDFVSYEVRLTGRKGADLATVNRIIGRIALKSLSFSLLTQRVTILVPANEVWEIKGMTMHFVPLNTTGIKPFDIGLIDFATSFFPTSGQVLAIDVDVKTGNVMMGPVAVVVTPPVVVPPPVVTPPPPPPVGVSPDGSVITPASGGSLTTAAGTWTFGTATGAGGNIILLNGAPALSGEATELYVLNGGNLYAFNSFSNWFQWAGGWTRLSAAPPGAPHP